MDLLIVWMAEWSKAMVCKTIYHRQSESDSRLKITMEVGVAVAPRFLAPIAEVRIFYLQQKKKEQNMKKFKQMKGKKQ